MWNDAPGIDSLGDAQTIIQSNYLLPFYCGSLFLRTANLELFVKTENPFDWDKAKILTYLDRMGTGTYNGSWQSWLWRMASRLRLYVLMGFGHLPSKTIVYISLIT